MGFGVWGVRVWGLGLRFGVEGSSVRNALDQDAQQRLQLLEGQFS